MWVILHISGFHVCVFVFCFTCQKVCEDECNKKRERGSGYEASRASEAGQLLKVV